MTYTSGPWHVVPYGDGDSLVICSDEAGDWRIAFMATMIGPEEIDGPIRANARLISAAPDMYEALTDLITSLEATWRNGFAAIDDVQKEVEWAKAALLKAKGEST